MDGQLLSGKTAVITGCNRGIGYELLRVFLENGADIIACLRRADSAFKKTRTALEKDCEGHVIDVGYFDLANPTEVKTAVKELVGKKYNIDIIVNNAIVHITDTFAFPEMI